MAKLKGNTLGNLPQFRSMYKLIVAIDPICQIMIVNTRKCFIKEERYYTDGGLFLSRRTDTLFIIRNVPPLDLSMSSPMFSAA